MRPLGAAVESVEYARRHLQPAGLPEAVAEDARRGMVCASPPPRPKGRRGEEAEAEAEGRAGPTERDG